MKANRSIPKPIRQLAKRVDNWRQTRAQRGRMPEALWTEAGKLADTYGVYAVARGAGLAYDGVKKRAKGPLPKAALNGAFVELPMVPSGHGMMHEIAVVELRDGNGRSLAIRMMPEALSELPQVAAGLWSLS